MKNAKLIERKPVGTEGRAYKIPAHLKSIKMAPAEAGAEDIN